MEENKIILGKHVYKNKKNGEWEDCNYQKIWFDDLSSILKQLNHEQVYLTICLIDDRNEENIIFGTQSSIAKKYEVSERTLRRLFSQLQKLNLVSKINNGVYMINPDIIWQGSAETRQEAMAKYNKVQPINPNDITSIEIEIGNSRNKIYVKSE